MFSYSEYQKTIWFYVLCLNFDIEQKSKTSYFIFQSIQRKKGGMAL